RRRRQPWSSLLSGLLYCGCGRAMVHTYTSRHDRQYHFYVCSKHIHERAAACPGSRVRMDQMDDLVVGRLSAMGRDRALVAATVEASGEVDHAELRGVLARLTPLWEVMQLRERQRVLHLLLDRVTYTATTNDMAFELRDCGLRALTEQLT